MATPQNSVAAFAGAMTPLSAGASVALGAAGFRLVQLDAEAEAAAVFQSIAAELGPVACLVNSSALLGADTLFTTSQQNLTAHLDANVTGPALLAQGFAKALPAGQHGLIINLAGHALAEPVPEPFAATLSESALWSLTRLLAQALAPAIRVNLITPGPALAVLPSSRLDPDVVTQRVSEAVRYLLDAEAVTGQMIALDI